MNKKKTIIVASCFTAVSAVSIPLIITSCNANDNNLYLTFNPITSTQLQNLYDAIFKQGALNFGQSDPQFALCIIKNNKYNIESALNISNAIQSITIPNNNSIQIKTYSQLFSNGDYTIPSNNAISVNINANIITLTSDSLFNIPTSNINIRLETAQNIFNSIFNQNRIQFQTDNMNSAINKLNTSLNQYKQWATDNIGGVVSVANIRIINPNKVIVDLTNNVFANNSSVNFKKINVDIKCSVIDSSLVFESNSDAQVFIETFDYNNFANSIIDEFLKINNLSATMTVSDANIKFNELNFKRNLCLVSGVIDSYLDNIECTNNSITINLNAKFYSKTETEITLNNNITTNVINNPNKSIQQSIVINKQGMFK